MEKHSSCDIIIPTYNGASHLPRLLASIGKQSFQHFDCFVIDDNSSDNTVEIIRKDFSWVHLIEQTENMGPSHNRNVAAQVGVKPYVIIFDDDTYLEDQHWLAKAISIMQQNKDIGQIATMIVNGFDPEVLLDCGIVKNWYLFGGAFHKVHHENARGKHEQGRMVLGACSAGTVLRRDLFDKVGGFDAKYYYPCEDLDLSLRIHLAGYKVWYEPSLKVFHYESQAMGKSLARKMYLYRRNCLLVLTENFPVVHVIGMYLCMIGKEILLPLLDYLASMLPGKARQTFPLSVKDYLKSMLFNAKYLFEIIGKRISSRRFRKRSRWYLLSVNKGMRKDIAK